jgi:hypothetical protein
MSTSISLLCGDCKKPMEGAAVKCSNCRSFGFICALCRLPVTGLVHACGVCGHGGHVEVCPSRMQLLRISLWAFYCVCDCDLARTCLSPEIIAFDSACKLGSEMGGSVRMAAVTLVSLAAKLHERDHMFVKFDESSFCSLRYWCREALRYVLALIVAFK